MRSTFFITIFLIAATASASQPLETETARILPAGFVKLEATNEFQTSKEGTERAFPLVFEYGFGHGTELAIEPVFGTSIRPKNGPHASGAGDVEVTLTHLFLPENGGLPAIAAAGEIKFPTARNRLIGSGKADYAAFLIASKRFNRLDVHANLGYTVVGKPAGTHLSNIVNYAFAEEFHINPRFDFVGELVGNTSSTGDKTENPAANLPAEVTLAETAALLGVRYYPRPGLFFSVGVSYDNNHAWLIRPGITYRFGTR